MSHQDLSSKRVLVFPAGMPKALEYVRLLPDGVQVIGASSLRSDPMRSQYPLWDFLPYVNAPDFAASLKAVIERYGITHVYSPHQVVWFFLRNHLQEIAPGVALDNIAPLKERLMGAYEAKAFARESFSLMGIHAALEGKRGLSDLEKAGLFNYFRLVPGESDYSKLVGFYEAMRHCAKGDVVEIGSLWGRSAFALTWLAKRFDVGNILCVDPWTTGHLEGDDHADIEVHESYDQYHDIRDAHDFFQMNLSVFRGHVNCIKDFSYKVVDCYEPGLTLANDTLGSVTYKGRIGFLHVDGNHTYESTLQDIQQWMPKVVPGGWIVVDDYVWAFNDGPRRAADQVMFEQAQKLESAFVIGGALFMQLKY